MIGLSLSTPIQDASVFQFPLDLVSQLLQEVGLQDTFLISHSWTIQISCGANVADYFISCTAFAVTPFLGGITPFSKPGRCFGNYVASLGRSFTVVNTVCSRPAFRVSSVVIRSVFMNVISIQT